MSLHLVPSYASVHRQLTLDPISIIFTSIPKPPQSIFLNHEPHWFYNLELITRTSTVLAMAILTAGHYYARTLTRMERNFNIQQWNRQSE